MIEPIAATDYYGADTMKNCCSRVGSYDIGSVDLRHTCGQKYLLQPADSIATLGAVSEERSLHGTGKSDEK